MTNGDAAAALGLSFKAASKRYTKALDQLEQILNALPGDTSGQGATRKALATFHIEKDSRKIKT
jgi:hypothetical protein